MKHNVCAWYVRTLVYVHVCTYIAQSITGVLIIDNSTAIGPGKPVGRRGTVGEKVL